jgi:hypothetical protein
MTARLSDRAQLSDLKAVKSEWSERLLAAPTVSFRASSRIPSAMPSDNVVGVGVGEKLEGLLPTGVMAIKFLVRKKYPKEHLSKNERLPSSINGLPVDVEEVGLLRALPARRQPRRKSALAPDAQSPNPRRRYRPAQPGASIGFEYPGNAFVMAGTFGARVGRGGKWYVLSNNHVLANENQLAIGSGIYQPGLLDKGKVSTDKIAELAKFIPLKAEGFNKVDCAIALGTPKSVLSNLILGIGAPTGFTDARVDMVVQKFGRTTSYTAGRVTSVDTDVKVGYDTGNFLFRSQIIIVGISGRPFSDSGDSGSLILERSSRLAVGLLFGGSRSHTIANHISQVLSSLNVTLS